MKSIAIKLPEDLLERLDAASARRSVGRSALVREAVQKLVDGSTRLSPRGSFAERAARFAGCAKGPRDLASSPRHMKGYGV